MTNEQLQDLTEEFAAKVIAASSGCLVIAIVRTPEGFVRVAFNRGPGITQELVVNTLAAMVPEAMIPTEIKLTKS